MCNLEKKKINKLKNVSTESRGDHQKSRMSGRKFASAGYQTHNHQVMNATRSPLSRPGGSEVGGRANDGVGLGSIDTASATEN